MSKLALERTIPVRPPIVNSNTNERDQYNTKLLVIVDANIVANQLNILIPVGTAITMVAALK
jgi:hypothetical protein